MIMQRPQSGFGLLEVILVTALVLVAGAIVFAVFESARPSSQASTEVTKLSTLATNLKGAYGINHDYSGLSVESVIDNHQLLPDMINTTTTAKSQWGAVELTPAAINGNINRGFQIVYRDVPTNACLKFVLGAAPLFPSGIAVGTGTSINVLKTDHTVDMTLAVPACSPTDSDSVDVVFVGQ